MVAGVTGLEPAASCVTGRRSNQLSYTPKWWALKDSNLRPSRCKRDALPTELSAQTKFHKVLQQKVMNVKICFKKNRNKYNKLSLYFMNIAP